MLREGRALVLARHLPPRFDIAAESRFPAGLRPAVLAHELRKDLWRCLQRIRGFSPVVRIEEDETGLSARAGGAVLSGRHPCDASDRIAALLADPARRARWIAHAGRRRI